ncbi:MAG: tryptophan synthase subunit alpha [Alphaproteobacteria bacterium]|uniref:Tryptophan synthase alpha chain n=1 Tax=Candidatus Nitrobium versatile TaxID=2884831 RepID=A0A953J9T3_9BACT|nr:tryptophan synthase subunit alpha [Candidatus Nitrobium versatile]
MSEGRGRTRISAAFERLRASGKKAFIPYLMAGDPCLETTRERILLLERCGADIIELGVPFSDPLADGPTIQAAAERALTAGVTLQKVISFTREMRRQTQVPLVFMTYYNLIFKYGEERFVRDAAEAGVDGVIIPDLPPDEAGNLLRLAGQSGQAGKKGNKGRLLDTIFLIAPTSTEERIRTVAAACSGFVYYVSMTGITGSKLTIDKALQDHLSLIRQATDKPVAVGFGVAKAEDARILGDIADGVIVGSALVRKFHEEPADAERFIKELREAI